MWLFLVFLTVPLIEIGLFITVGEAVGLWPTLGIVILTAVIGTALVRSRGAMALNNLRGSFNQLNDPTEHLAHGAMIIFSGALLLTPGFFTDAVGLSMFIPPLRALARAMLLKRFSGKVSIAGAPGGFAFGANFGTRTSSAGRAGRSFIDVDEVQADRIPTTELPSDE